MEPYLMIAKTADRLVPRYCKTTIFSSY